MAENLLNDVRERNERLRELRDAHPESIASSIADKLGGVLSAFGSRQSRQAAESAALSSSMAQDRADTLESRREDNNNAMRQERIGKQQVDAISLMADESEAGTRRVIGSLDKLTLEVRYGLKALKQAVQFSGGLGGGLGDMLPGGDKGKAGLLKKVGVVGAVLAGGYTVSQGAENASKVFDGDADTADRLRAGAHLLTSGAGAGIGGILGGAQGAAYGAAAGEALASVGDKIGDSIAGTDFGDMVGRGVALAISPFSDDARKSLATEYHNSILPAMQKTFDPVIDSISDFGDSAKDLSSNLMDAGSKFLGGVSAGAHSLWSGVKAAANDVMAGNVSKAASAMGEAGRQAYGQVSAGAQTARGLAVGRYNAAETTSISKATEAGEEFKGGKGLTAATKNIIGDVSKQYGVDANAMLTMAQLESGGNPNAVSATGAAGLFQETSGTARAYGVTNRFDPRANAEGAAKLMVDNRKALQAAGLDASVENLYLAHQQGAGGAIQILRAAQGQGTISDEVRKNMGLNYGNMDPRAYLEANRKRVAMAAQAAQTTYAGTYTDATSPIQVATTTSGVPGTEKVAMAETTKVTTEPVRKVSASAPPEVQSVAVTNQPQPEASKPKSTVVQTPPRTVPSNVPSLAEIPPFFPELGLVGIMTGRV